MKRHLRQHLAARAQRPSGPALPGGPALHRSPPRRSRAARRTPNRRRARPSRPVHPRTHRRTRLADAAGTPARPRRRNRQAPTPPPTRSRRGRDLSTAGDMAAVLDWRLPDSRLDPGPLPWLPGIPPTLQPIPSGGPTWQSDPNWSPTSPTRSKTTPARVTPSRSGLHQEATRAPPSSATSQCGAPPTASIPKIPTNRRNPTRNAPGPVETTPRPGYRACHQPARRCEGRQATRRTHRTQSKGRQAAPVPTTRTASEQAVRARPIAHLSRQIAALRT